MKEEKEKNQSHSLLVLISDLFWESSLFSTYLHLTFVGNCFGKRIDDFKGSCAHLEPPVVLTNLVYVKIIYRSSIP